ncbi:DMT family transporter [Ruegeria sediminis]|uniref:DMT family transporter n=1 Tax=Ruegeria sediminis TaxID=2583820 RepID=A0ABY2WSV8_9RHOB|nr:DMT family transporter [Ruegeria sediminis]TMV03782.1 DMT family transporter [Ruegeria sediminis]
MAATYHLSAPIAAAAYDSRPVVGIMWLLLATTLFPIQDVIIKSLSGEFAVHQIVFWRSVFALPLVAAIAWYEGSLWPLKLGSVPLQLLRAASTFGFFMAYYMALAAIGMAETAAITFSTPIFVTILATVFLSERVGLYRWFAVAVGLVGVVVIVQPGAAVFEPAAVLALLAAISYAISIICTRRLGNRSNGGMMSLFAVVFFVVVGGVLGAVFSGLESGSPHPSIAFLYRDWVSPTPADWLLLLALGGISGVGFFALSQAYRLAEASVVTTFEYTYLPWSVLWGYLMFGALPNMSTWIGLTLIGGAGLLIVFRETLRGRRVMRPKGASLLRQR